MFRIEITAETAVELISGIRGLAGAMANPENDVPTQARVIDAQPTALAVESVVSEPDAKPARKPRTKKADDSSAAPEVGSVDNSGSTQTDIEDAIAAKSGEPVEAAPLTMSRDELKNWIITEYLNKCLDQPARPAAFKAVMQEAGCQNFTSAPDDALPKIKAIVDRKIAETPEIK